MRDIGQEHNRESEGERGGLVPEPAPSYKGVGLAKCVHCQLSSGDKSRVHGAASPHPSTAQPSTPPTNQLHSLSSFSKTMARTQNKRKSNQTNLPGRDERLSYGQKVSWVSTSPWVVRCMNMCSLGSQPSMLPHKHTHPRLKGNIRRKSN